MRTAGTQPLTAGLTAGDEVGSYMTPSIVCIHPSYHLSEQNNKAGLTQTMVDSSLWCKTSLAWVRGRKRKLTMTCWSWQLKRRRNRGGCHRRGRLWRCEPAMRVLFWHSLRSNASTVKASSFAIP